MGAITFVQVRVTANQAGTTVVTYSIHLLGCKVLSTGFGFPSYRKYILFTMPDATRPHVFFSLYSAFLRKARRARKSLVVMQAMGEDGSGMRDGLAKQEFNTMLDEGSTEVSSC